MEVLAKLLDGVDDKPADALTKNRRLNHIYCSSPVPYWKVKQLQAEILRSLGCIAEALAIFESLKMWDEVVLCYKGLNQVEKAESLIRKLLVDEPNQPLLHCYLGDLSGNPEHYERAIELSGDKCAHARTEMGKMSMNKKAYSEAMSHFRRSLELQPLQVGVWFNLGFSAMHYEDYQEAARAYHRLVTFEPEYFEAWNNLAKCYVHLNQRERAQKVIKEAVKLKTDSDKLWQNLVFISASIGEWKDAMGAVESLLNMDKWTKVDEQVLEIMLKEVIDSKDEVLVAKLAQLMARIVHRQSLNSKVLRLYAELKKPSEGQEDLAAWSIYAKLLEDALVKERVEGNKI